MKCCGCRKASTHRFRRKQGRIISATTNDLTSPTGRRTSKWCKKTYYVGLQLDPNTILGYRISKKWGQLRLWCPKSKSLPGIINTFQNTVVKWSTLHSKATKPCAKKHTDLVAANQAQASNPSRPSPKESDLQRRASMSVCASAHMIGSRPICATTTSVVNHCSRTHRRSILLLLRERNKTNMTT